MSNTNEKINITDEKIKELTEEALKNVAGGELPVGQCPVCGLSFASTSELKKHQIKAHRNS